MRVTTAQMYNTLLSGVKQQQTIQDQGNAQIASGTKFQTPAQAGTAYTGHQTCPGRLAG